MKVYSIRIPEQLERAADVCKWPSHRAKVMKYIGWWQEHIDAGQGDSVPPVTLELGRQAQLFRHDGGRKQMLGTMIVIGARQFVDREGMVAER